MPNGGAEIKAMHEVKTVINVCTFETQNSWIVLRTAGCLPFSLSLVFIVTCLLWRESSLSLCLFLFSWHSWWGKSRIPNKVQSITYSARYFGATVGAMSSSPELKAEIWKCVLLPQYYPWLVRFVSNVCPDHVHRGAAQQRNSCLLLNEAACEGKFNMWLRSDNTGVWADLLCPGAGWWRRATRSRMRPLWASENSQDTRRMS